MGSEGPYGVGDGDDWSVYLGEKVVLLNGYSPTPNWVADALNTAHAHGVASAAEVVAECVVAMEPLVFGLAAYDGAIGIDDEILVRHGTKGIHTIRQSDLRRLAAALARAKSLTTGGEAKP